MFDAFFNAIAAVLAWFYELPIVGGSYAAAIVLLTLTVMVVLTPLTLKGTRSMMSMQALQPEMKRIQREFKDDRQAMNEELLKFYKAHQINPLGGCLPLLLQMPVFIVLFQVLNGLTRTGEDGTFDPKYLDQGSQLYQDLSGSTEMMSWGLNLAESAAQALQVSFVHGLPYIVLIIAVAGTSYAQQRQISGRNPGAEIPAQQKMLLRIMPLFFAFISFNFAAGLVIYFLVSNLYRIAQQAYISHSLYGIGGLAMFVGGGTPTKGIITTSATEVDGDGPGPSPTKGKDEGRGRTTPPKNKPTGGRTTPPKGTPSGGRTTPPKRSPANDGSRPAPRDRRKKRS